MNQYYKKTFLLICAMIFQLHIINTFGQIVPTVDARASFNEKSTKALIAAPGGVTRGLSLWLRADDPNSLELVSGTNNVSAWKNQASLNSYTYTYADVTGVTAKVYPVYNPYEEKMNFFPSINFSSYAYLALNSTTGPYLTANPEETSSFVSYWADVKQLNSLRLYTHGVGSTNPTNSTTRHPAIGFSPREGAGRIFLSGDGGSLESTAGFVPFSTALELVRIHAANGVRNAGFVEFNFFSGNKERIAQTSASFGTAVQGTSGGVIGGASIGPASTNSGSFIGLMSDVIFYNNTLTDDEIDLIGTYLGIKYGITIDKNTTSVDENFDYILSDGTTNVWKGNSAPNKSYHNNVAGIVRDDASLFVNKSKSTTSKGIVGMMSQTHTELGQGSEADPIFTSNLSGLFWGDDNLDTEITYSQTNDECFDFTTRTSRTWLVQKTNADIMPVTIFMGKGGADNLDNYVNSSYQAYMLVANSKEDLDNKNWSMVIPGSFDRTLNFHKFNYSFTQPYTYFTLAFKALPTACETCTFQNSDSFTLTSSNLGTSGVRVTQSTGTITKSNLLSNGGNEIVDVSFSIESGISSMRVQPGSARGATRLTSVGSANSGSTITYTLSTPTEVNFAIGNIDKNEIVTITGVCNNQVVVPSSIYGNPLSASQKVKGYTYEVRSGVIYGNGATSSGIGTPTGIANINFDFPVEKIIIKYTSSKLSNTRLDLFPLNFSCPKPLPSPNEDGFAMQKSAPASVNICDIVDFKFRILNSNGNCEGSDVYFEDILPEGMEWIPNSINFNGSLLVDNEIVTTDDNRLTIEKLHLPSNGGITTVRAQAIFKENAAINTTYYNQSTIKYVKLDNITNASLQSVDANYTSGTDTRTPIFVENDPSTTKSINTQLSLDKSCFMQDGIITVSLAVYNENLAIPNLILDLSYNDNFHFVPGSFMINGATDSNAVESIEVDSEGEASPGYTQISGFTLPQNAANGNKVIISYKIKVPQKSNLEFETINGKDVYTSLNFDYNFLTTEINNLCITNAFTNASGYGSLDYCYSKNYIISNKNVTNIIRR